MRSLACLLLAIICIGCADQNLTNSDAAPESTTQAAMTAETGAEMTEVAFNVAGAPTYEFNVPSMMCPEGCAPKVREALAEQPGVKEVRVVYETKTATVAVDLDQFDPQAAIAELEDEYGFADTTLKSAPAVTPEVSLPAEGNVDG